MATATTVYRDARDLLLAQRGEDVAAPFSWPKFEGAFNWAVDWFDVIARGNGDPGLIVLEEDGSSATYTFDVLARRSDQVANWLRSHGVGKGDRVLLMLGNQVELWECMLGVMKVGGVVLPTTLAVGTQELVDRMDRGGARVVITNADQAAKFEEVPGDYLRISIGDPTPGWLAYADSTAADESPAGHPGTMADDSLLLYFTSGTTSRPKLVEHTQTSYPVGHLSTMYWIGLRPGDRHLNISSPGWAKHAWSSFFAPWIAEATIVVFNYAKFDAGILLERLESVGVTTFCAPPTVWRMLIQSDLTGRKGQLREAVAAGEPLNPEVIAQVAAAWGLTIRDGFGQTETSAQVGNPPGFAVKPGSMGRPLPGMPVVLVDPLTGLPAAEGEICLDLASSPVGLMTGYLDDAERNAEAMANGYYHTGDIASRDADGYLTYVGRTDDVFKASDYKVSPFELESVLIEHSAVVEAAVVPAPDPIRHAVPKAYVSLAEGWPADRETALSILAHARANLAPYLRVRRLEFAELPKTISGKIRRVDLRKREEEAAEGALVLDEWRDDQFPELRA